MNNSRFIPFVEASGRVVTINHISNIFSHNKVIKEVHNVKYLTSEISTVQ